MMLTINAIRRSALCFIAGLAAATVTAPHNASAELDHYRISDTITRAKFGVPFPGKSVGETFQGSFTIDTDAMLQSTGNGGMLGNYAGAFAVVIEGRRSVVGRIGPTDTLLRNGDERWSAPNAQLLNQVVVR